MRFKKQFVQMMLNAGCRLAGGPRRVQTTTLNKKSVASVAVVYGGGGELVRAVRTPC